MPINMQPLGENTANIPAFLGKLWKMVNDPATDHLICWSPAGNSFIIQNQAQFWYELLPLYYKHNNMSSFVRQLNMYGFHKMSTVENGTMDADKDENQFYHPYFQKDQPEILVNIKRKVTASKSAENNVQNVLKHDDIAKVITDVKQLKTRQSSVDSQLSAMKQENAVLWRELAMLRQKHIKQQQIVNKLIQFLVTLVQPSTASRMGVGVKRRMPLMLHESPAKKSKSKKPVRSDLDGGPTIHELDSEIEISPEELLEHEIEDQPVVASPVRNVSTSPQSGDGKFQSGSVSSPAEGTGETISENFWDKPEFEITQINPEELISDNELTEENLTDLQSNTSQSNEKVFLNPTARDTLLTNLVNGSYNSNILNGKNSKKTSNNTTSNASAVLTDINTGNNTDMTVATRDYKINSGTLGTNECCREDLDLHLESTQSEIDQLKDILHGCNSLDANALLGLFNDDQPSYGLSVNQNRDDLNSPTGSQLISTDPMVSGTELATCGNNLIDFNELFDDSIDGQDAAPTSIDSSSTVNTPLIIKSEPLFPTFDKEI
ncbi:heat shock factor protein isoform X2 [Anoplophora glabripennis]|uniref:heat shock factor protein isoform X2 n=1 Tax=Anoplophora glabripennis TaxID=217634 RepID=UPI0008734EEF|nr:heat shock factor protein isoform X2 [Anoplophora glabripennis]